MPVRPSLRGTALLAATVLVAGCGSDDAGSSGDAAAFISPAGSGGAFPVTVGTAFGDVEIPEEPQRVVALGWSDAETALALGVQDQTLSNAFSSGSALGTQYALANAVPLFAEALQ
jgi:iron complex transport system substrate-binding protein